MSARIGIDVGGTFTDLVLQDEETGDLTIAKVLSTSPDPAEGVFSGFRALLDRAGTVASDISYLAHASTIASNLVIERKGDRTALITTEEFRDVLHLQRQKRADLYDLFYDKPRPLIDRRDIYEVPERVLADGQVLQPLNEERTREIVRDIAQKGIGAVAVVLLHSYANPEHEKQIREIAAGEAPELLVSLSSDVSPKWREYERSSTTAMNAYVMPRVVGYLDRMQESLRGEGMTYPLHVMQCSGGVVVAEAMKRSPILMLESGPAAGALAGGVVGRSCGRERVIAFDMGGTTAKVSIIENGEPHLVEEFEIAHEARLRAGSGLPVTVPTVDLIEIGTGGGSIAHLEIGVLAVGPASAGASPGPVCYGLGGNEPTVTDADLVLGYLDPDYFLGGELRLDAQAARAAIHSKIAQPLALSVEEAAYAIHSVANASMANAMRVMTIQKGLDPREFAAVAFGGAGPSHIASMAEELGIEAVIVPVNAGVASALGLLVARVKFEFARTLITQLERAALPTMNRIFSDLETRGRTALQESGASEGSMLLRQVRMRYVGQGYEITVDIRPDTIGVRDLAVIRESFLDTYRRLYGYADPDGALEFVDWRLTALGPALDATLTENGDGGVGDRPERETRRAYFPSLGGFVEADVWNRYRLTPGTQITGPAVIQERESTTLLPPGVSGLVDNLRNLVLTVPRRETRDGS